MSVWLWFRYLPEWLQAVLFFGAAPILFWLGSRGSHGKWISLIAYLYAAGYWALIIYAPIGDFRPQFYDFLILALIFCLGFLHNKNIFLALALGVMFLVPLSSYLVFTTSGKGDGWAEIGVVFWHLILCLPIVALLLGQWWYYRKFP